MSDTNSSTTMTGQEELNVVRKLEPDWGALISLILKYWNNDPLYVEFVENKKRNEPDLINAMFCEHNQYIAAKTIFEGLNITPKRKTSKKKQIEMAKEMCLKFGPLY